MGNCGYTVFKEHMNTEETGSYVTYGIRLGNELAVSDISLNEEEAMELADRMNAGELDPVHFYDVIEDFLES